MAMNDLLKEAIADAKAVRETALANAKSVLEEAFAPKLQSMLSATLQNESDEFDADDNEDFSLDGELDGGDSEFDNSDADSFDELDSEPSDEDLDDIDSSVDLDDEDSETDDSFDYPEQLFSDDLLKELQASTYDDDDTNDDSDDEFSLNSIINELEDEASAEDEYDDMESDSGVFGDEASDDSDLGNSGFGDDDSKDSLFTQEEIAGIVNMNKNHTSKNESVDLQDLINELKSEYVGKNKKSSNTRELFEVKKKLNEHIKVIKFLKLKLNEVNLLNAKLLFTNKLFKNHAMNESQKLKVIETLDRATTLKECKLVYSTLEEAYMGMKKSDKRVPGKHIVESMASRVVNSTRPSEATVKTVINEGYDLASRFKKLAGITK